MTGSAGRGRPRSPKIDEAVRVVTHRLLEEVGYSGLAVEQVAALAGVGKSAIYRRWRSKAELVFAQVMHDLDLPAPPDTGSLRGDLAAILLGFMRHLQKPAARAALPGLLGDLMNDPLLAARFTDTFNVPERTLLQQVLERAVARGEIPRRPDPVEVHTLLIGPLFAWQFLYGRQPEEEYGRRLVEAVTAGVRAIADIGTSVGPSAEHTEISQ